MKSHIKQSVMAFCSSIILISCVTTEGDSELGDDINERGSDCISIRTIRDYTPLDRSSLLIIGSGKRAYYVTFLGSSFELRSSHRIAVDSRDDWLCPYGGDRLIFDGFNNGGVSIRGIDRLTSEQADELLYRFGKKERPEEMENQAPAEVGGAEIEEIGEQPAEQNDQVPENY